MMFTVPVLLAIEQIMKQFKFHDKNVLLAGWFISVNDLLKEYYIKYKTEYDRHTLTNSLVPSCSHNY